MKHKTVQQTGVAFHQEFSRNNRFIRFYYLVDKEAL